MGAHKLVMTHVYPIGCFGGALHRVELPSFERRASLSPPGPPGAPGPPRPASARLEPLHPSTACVWERWIPIRRLTRWVPQLLSHPRLRRPGALLRRLSSARKHWALAASAHGRPPRRCWRGGGRVRRASQPARAAARPGWWKPNQPAARHHPQPLCSCPASLAAGRVDGGGGHAAGAVAGPRGQQVERGGEAHPRQNRAAVRAALAPPRQPQHLAVRHQPGQAACRGRGQRRRDVNQPFLGTCNGCFTRANHLA